jgi:large conductance mechanosensitive channel
MWKDFRDFAAKGNVVDLAIGVVMGTAFGKITSSLVEKMIMPIIGYLIGGVDFSHLKLVLQLPGISGRDEVSIGYGDFIQAGVNFFIIAWSMYMVVKLMKRFKLQSTPETPEQTLLLREIRDLLKTHAN